MTERPRTEATFPGADLWFFCEGQLNILGNSIDACIPAPNLPNGTVCQPQVATAICELLGYEQAFEQDTVIAPANASEPVISLNGQYCLRQGQYSNTLPDDLDSLPGQPCNKISKLTCIRTLSTLATAANAGLQEAMLSALHPAPAAEDLATTARVAEANAVQTQPGPQATATMPQANATMPETPPTVGPSGRKLLAM